MPSRCWSGLSAQSWKHLLKGGATMVALSSSSPGMGTCRRDSSGVAESGMMANGENGVRGDALDNYE